MSTVSSGVLSAASGDRLSPPIRTIIVDDEPLARERLLDLARRAGDVDVIAVCADGREAVDVLRRTAVELVLLDVQMPRLDGFGVVAEIGANAMPPVIFTSAFSEFAVRAFEAYALDYLLKPFDNVRFDSALARARVLVSARRQAEPGAASKRDARLAALIEHARANAAGYPDSLAIRTGGHYAVVRTADITWIEADGNYSNIYVDQRPRLLSKTLAALERDVLDPDMFVRVHRSAIVNRTKIAAIEPLPYGELVLVLHDSTRVPCSRRYRKNLESRLVFTS